LSKYKVCIIGCGDIGFLFDYDRKIDGALTHFKAFSDSKNFEVEAVAEKKKAIRDIIKSKFKTPVYDDYKKMCNEIRPDVIAVATNDELHFEILTNLLKCKPKLVFCEKPLALKSDEVIEITDKYRKANVHLQVNFTRRFLNEFKEIGEIIMKKKIGDIESATFYYSRGLIHNASHYLDLVNRYIKETEKNLINISVKDGISKSDTTVSFDMIYKNGMEVRFIGLKPTKLSFAEIDIVGTKGRIKVNYKNEIEKYKVVTNKIFKGYSAYELYESKPIRFEKALPNAVKNIYGVLEKKEKLISPASNSIKIFELINRIKENL
jgi:predicted dehydrogenase